MMGLKKSDLAAIATFGLLNEVLAWQGSDVGKIGSLDKLLSDLGIFRTVAASAAGMTPHTGTTAETAFATIALPIGGWGNNGLLRVTTLWTFSGAAAKTPRVRLGGIGGTAFLDLAQTSNLAQQHVAIIRNRNSASSQIGYAAGSAAFNAGSAANVTSAVNTAAAHDLVISGQLASAAESMALEAYHVEILKRP
jgi:hypothetical protein